MFKGEDCCDWFIRELDDLGEFPELQEGHEEDERREIIILFHNLKGLDGVPYEWFIQQCPRGRVSTFCRILSAILQKWSYDV